MKNRSPTISEAGFVLPSVIFLISILLIVFLANASIYALEINMGKHMIEQIKIESLIQLGLESYKAELQSTKEFLSQVSYQFPQGEVEIIATKNEPTEEILVNLNIHTDENQEYITNLTISLLND